MESRLRKEIEQLPLEDKIERIKELRSNKKIADMTVLLGFKNPASYYNWLKKQSIYDEVTRHKAPPSLAPNISDSIIPPADEIKPINSNTQSTVSFNYDVILNADTAAALLRKVAAFIDDEVSEFSITLNAQKIIQ